MTKTDAIKFFLCMILCGLYLEEKIEHRECSVAIEKLKQELDTKNPPDNAKAEGM